MSETPAAAAPRPAEQAVLEARGLTKRYRIRQRGGRPRQVLDAAADVSFALQRGRIVALVGESGSGKSTVARMLALLEPPTSGSLLLDGGPVRARGARAQRAYRSRVQLVLQDPFASLNPMHSVAYHLARPLRIHGIARTRAEVDRETESLLQRVRLVPADQFARKLPHELSGGQRQRVAIAAALAARPEVLLLDEPVSMLDVSIRLGLLNLMAELGREEGLAMLYITHDIASARHFADTILVMYRGHVVEGGPAERITSEPSHPYTQLLLAAAPDPDRAGAEFAVPGPAGPTATAGGLPAGCAFRDRCPHAMAVCAQQVPPPLPAGTGHWSACWLADPEHAASAPAAADNLRP